MGALLALPASAQAAFPGQNGKIAFDGGPGNNEIYVVNPDGSGLTNLTNDPASDEVPKWSPDGRRISYLHGSGFRVMNADGSDVRPLPIPSQEVEFSWAPDGQRAAYAHFAPDNVACPGAQFEIFTANLDGTVVKQLTTSPTTDDVEPAWSPDGNKIAFIRQDRQFFVDYCDIYSSNLYVMNADGTGLTQLTNSVPGYAYWPDWSPDGTKIAYEVDTGSDYEIYSINADGTGNTQLTNNTDNDLAPAWSPDGTKIVFFRYLNGSSSSDIFVMNADGTSQTNITNTSGTYERQPDWQPLPTSSPQPSYDHPRYATPVRVSLVPNFRQTISSSQCTARGGLNSTHGSPLALSSCNPPGFVPGTQAHMGPGSSSWAFYAVIYGDTNPANGNQANMTLRANLNDIRTQAGADYNPNPSGADLTLVTKLRITDRYNGGSQTDSATVQDFDYQTAIDCTSTAGPEGSTCALDTSANAIAPDTIRENKASVVQVFDFRVKDSGSDGVRGNSDDRTFAGQGIYVP
jgi:Tol biopolymer transport system component